MRHSSSKLDASAPIGIDLGTSHSRVAVCQGGDVVVLPTDHRLLSTPTCVAFAGNEVLIGEAALQHATTSFANTVFAPHHLIGCTFTSPVVRWYQDRWGAELVDGGDGGVRFKVEFKGGACLISPEEVLSHFLRQLRQRTEAQLGRTVRDAVVAVPSLCGRMQRKALSQVFREIRVNVVKLVKAPTAACLGFIAANGHERMQTLLVCDLGSALFDIGVLTRGEDGTVTERAITTEHVDHDVGLMRHCTNVVHDPSLAAASMLRLRQECDAAKRALSSERSASISVPTDPPRESAPVNIDQMFYETLYTQDVYSMLENITYCLEDVGLDKADVDAIVMVGGASRIPVFRRGLRQCFHGQKLCDMKRPDHAVVLGAAVYAGILAGVCTGKEDILAAVKDVKVVPLTSFAELADDPSMDVFPAELIAKGLAGSASKAPTHAAKIVRPSPSAFRKHGDELNRAASGTDWLAPDEWSSLDCKCTAARLVTHATAVTADPTLQEIHDPGMDTVTRKARKSTWTSTLARPWLRLKLLLSCTNVDLVEV